MKFWVPAIAAGAIAAGGGAAYYFLKVQPAQDVANPLTSFEILPQTTIAAGYFSLDDKTWKQASQFGTQEARDLIMQRIDELKATISNETPSGEPLDFDQDLKPWLGSVTFAGISNPDNREPDVLMVVGIKDKLEALKFATNQKDSADGEVTVSEFKGVEIYEFNESTQFLAVLDNHLVFSDQKSQIEAAIEIDQGAESILANPDVKAALTQSTTVKNPVAVGFVNPATLIAYMEEAGETDALAGNEAVINDLKQYQTMSIAWGIEEQGFRFKNVLKHTLDQEWQFDPLPGKVVSRFPDNTLALVHGGYLNQTWSLLQKRLAMTPEVKSQFDTFSRQFSQATQLDLERDVLSWMDGEFGFGVLPANEGVLAQLGFGGAIAIKTSDQAKANVTLDKLNTLARDTGAQVSTKDINGVSMTQFGIPLQSALVNYGWLDDETLLLTLGESAAQTLSGSSQPSVQKNAIFQATTSALPERDQGLFYLNARELLATARSSPAMSTALASTPEVDAILDSFEGLAFAGTQPDQNTAIGEALVTFTQQ